MKKPAGNPFRIPKMRIIYEMENEKVVLCGASKYEEKYYLNPEFNRLPGDIRDELQAMCVLFVEDVGGILTLEYDEEANLQFVTMADEGDLLYDEIGSALKIKQLQQTKQELLESLELYYQVFFLGKPLDTEEKE